MTTSPRLATAKVVITYWALISFGLAIFATLHADALGPLGPVCTGTLLGTAMGQILAWRRFRMWLAALVVIGLGLLVLPGLREELQGKPLWLTFLPAALCGYWSLGDRTSLASFWFPAMIWMLSILDHVETHALPGGTGLALFVSLVALFFVFLRVREERRISHWRTVAPSPLAVVRPVVVLQEAGGAGLARGVWGLIAATLALAATAWIAPMLWSPESLEAGNEAVAETQLGLPCCPKDLAVAPITHGRVKEYLDLERGLDHQGALIPGKDCKVCEAVVVGQITPGGYYPTGSYGYANPTGPMGSSGGDASPPSDDAPAPVATTSPVPVASGDVTTPPPAALYPPHVAPTVVSPPVVTPSSTEAVPRTPPPLDPHHASTLSAHTPVTSSAVSPRMGTSQSRLPDLLHWAAVLAAAMCLFQLFSLGLRPVRRYLALRHFRHPYWDETIDQRISNAWQLALVGLRDAGFRASVGEQPNALARRVPVVGLDRCATILDRTRHGVGIDDDDLATMTASSVQAYTAARSRLGGWARATSWLRWPLV